jgi:hypothetical protein
MDKRTIVLIVLFFGLIIAGMFTFAYLKRTELKANPEPVATGTVETDVPYANITRIDAKHFFIDGEHTIVGQVELPTPCDLLTAQSSVRESMPEQVVFDFAVTNTSDMCAQIITAQRFKVSAQASEGAALTATFMGRTVELNLIPAAAGETPDEFELFIKG